MIASLGMEEGVKTVPDIIREAAESPLGIFALMIICLSVLGFVFFRRANEYVKLGIFLCLFAGVFAFGFSIRNVTPRLLKSGPSIQITQVPPKIPTGSTGVDIGGEVHATDLASCRVLVYSHTDLWYIQPNRNGAIDIDSNGRWQGHIHGGSRYAAILVSQAFQPPLTTDKLPLLGTTGVLAIDEVEGK